MGLSLSIVAEGQDTQDPVPLGLWCITVPIADSRNLRALVCNMVGIGWLVYIGYRCVQSRSSGYRDWRNSSSS